MPPILSIPLSLLIYASCSRTAAAGSTLGFALFPLPTPPLLLATPGPATFLVPAPLLPATPGSCIVFAVLTAAHVPPLTETLTYPTSFGAHNHLSSGTKHKLCQYRCYPNHSNLCPYRVCKPDPRHGLLHTTEDGPVTAGGDAAQHPRHCHPHKHLSPLHRGAASRITAKKFGLHRNQRDTGKHLIAHFGLTTTPSPPYPVEDARRQLRL